MRERERGSRGGDEIQTSLFQWLKLMLTTHTALGLCGHCYCELSEYNVHTHALTHTIYIYLEQILKSRKKMLMALEVEVEKLRHVGYFLASYKFDMCEWN